MGRRITPSLMREASRDLLDSVGSKVARERCGVESVKHVTHIDGVRSAWTTYCRGGKVERINAWVEIGARSAFCCGDAPGAASEESAVAKRKPAAVASDSQPGCRPPGPEESGNDSAFGIEDVSIDVRR
jgi:hypothetical protein